MSLIRTLYRSVIPESVRSIIYHRKSKQKEKELLKQVITYLESPDCVFPAEEVKPVSAYLKKYGLHVFPYDFTHKYKSENIDVFFDEQSGMNYVMYAGEKLFLKKNWPLELIKEKFSFLLNEQDPQSAHCYLDKDFFVDDQSVLADIGAAEGIFVLPLIRKVKHVYLFETDPEWIEALQATFAPYKDKVTIVNKFVSNIDDDKNVKLDTFFATREKPDFLKIDVDGAESVLLEGAKDLLAADGHMKLAVCTYHKQRDQEEFDQLLKKNKFQTTISPGYMLFLYGEEELRAPYLRRGILRAWK